MPIYSNLEAIRKLTNSSLTSIIDVTNLNFKSVSDANLEFLNNISYNETTNSFQVYSGVFDFVGITDTLQMTLGGVPTLTIDSLGRITGQELLMQVAQTKRLRFTDFPDWPDIGVPGEIVYTGIQNQKPEFGEDFIGYLDGRGWVSLTQGNDAGDTGHKKYIRPTDIINIGADYQYWIYGNLTIEGIINNRGELVIANGTLIILPGGQLNNIDAGLVKIVNLATGISMQVVVRTFSVTAGNSVTITHGLDTSDFVFEIRDGAVLVNYPSYEIAISYPDNNSIILSAISTNIPDGTIVFQARI